MTALKKLYKYAVIASDVVVFTVSAGKLQVLLIKMKKEPYTDFWAAPGGLVTGNESVDKAASRILQSKTGVKDVYLEQFHTFGEVNRDPFGRVVSVAYLALIPNSDITLKTTGEYADVKWFSVNDLPKLAYDHRKIITQALAQLQLKLATTNIAYSLLPKEFPLSELQATYELILKKKLDKRNFRKKLFSLGLVRPTKGRVVGQAHRPAALYAFTSRSLQTIDLL